MNHYIMPLTDMHLAYRFLEPCEPWHLIALDALGQYGLKHPEHQWFVESWQGKCLGLLYRHKRLLHFAYYEAPPDGSPLYSFVKEFTPHFITHGSKKVLMPIIERLKGYTIQLNEECDFVRQTSQTKSSIYQKLPHPKGMYIRQANQQDFHPIMTLFQGSSIEHRVDSTLTFELILKRRVLVAVKHRQIIGTIMRLKETPRYTLLGGLFVHSQERKHGVARLLGQTMILDVMRQGKKVCFYYSDPGLSAFYQQGAFNSIGKWVSYSLTSKAVM